VPRYRSKEPQLVRGIALLVAMLHAKRGVNVKQFAERRGWTVRSVYRDLDKLQLAGVPIEHPEHGWFRIRRGWIESAAVPSASSGPSAPGGPGVPGVPGGHRIPREAADALATVRRLTPALDAAIGRTLDVVRAMLLVPAPGQQELALEGDTWLHGRSPPPIDYTRHTGVLEVLREAIAKRRAVQIAYRGGDARSTTRVVEPEAVWWEPSNESLYLLAWCRLRSAIRTFAVHRIASAVLLDDSCVSPRGAVAEMSKAYRLWTRPTTSRVRLRFAPRVAAEIRERRWHASQQLDELEDGSVLLAMDIAAPEELERWLLGFGPDVEILEPSQLAELVRARHVEAVSRSRAHMGPVRLVRSSILAERRRRRRTKA
jgi:predicted DNA-binding transcriptional regulator YafY